ncbi:MAG: hypothetical protein JNL05_06995 [Flavobacteriales bacterium]|nr:hypothetical protein [Flavobacteriales bacterium]
MAFAKPYSLSEVLLKARTALAAWLLVAMLAPCSAQNWESIGLPSRVIDWGNFYLDTVNNALYASGINQVFPGQTGIFRSNGNDWDTLGYFGNAVFSTLIFQDTLIAAGGFYTVNGDSTSFISFMDSTGWHPYGSFDAGIWRLRVLDGELYAVGGFETVDGQSADGIAKRVGGHWEPVGDFGVVPQPYLFDVIKYNGELVCCGNMSIIGQNYRDVYIFQNGQWGPLGGGLYGSVSGGWVMTIYHNELILGGNFYLGAGNAGQCIMRWNGSIWQPLGVGTTDNNDSYSSSYNIHALCVHDDKLFVGGGFSYAGHVPAQGIATWDGSQWCGLGSQLGLVHDIVFFNDSLYVMCGNQIIDGDTNTGGVRYLHTTYADTCSLTTGVNALAPPAEAAIIVSDEGVEVLHLPDGRISYSIIDAAGRVVRSGSMASNGGRSSVITTGDLATGLYVLRTLDGRALPFVPY